MSAVTEAGRRLEAAVNRLEAAVGAALPGVRRDGDPASESRELALLEAECHGLRQELEAVEERYRRVATAADDVAQRLDRTIDELSDIVEG